MNTFQLEFTPSAAANKAALIQGVINPSSISLIIDPSTLTETQRKLIAAIGEPTQGKRIAVPGYVEGNTIESVWPAIEAHLEKEIEREKKRKEYDAMRESESIATAEKYISGQDVSIYEWVNTPTMPNKFPEIAAKVEKERQRRADVETSKVNAIKAAHAAEVEALKQWALKSGSQHLKDLIEEGFNWQQKAGEEWVSAHTPQGFSDVSSEDDYSEIFPIKNPSSKEINVLRETRKTHPSARLQRVKFDDNEGGVWHKDYIQIELKAPARDSVWLEKFIENYND